MSDKGWGEGAWGEASSGPPVFSLGHWRAFFVFGVCLRVTEGEPKDTRAD